MVLLDLLERIQDILGEQFIGMYLYGSLAAGDFKLNRSDIDFVVVTAHLLPEAIIEELEAMHLALAQGSKWQQKLEGAYVPRAVIRRDTPEGPPVPTVNERQFYLSPLGSDWVMQRYSLRESKKVVYGPSPRELIDTVSSEDLRAAILDLIDEWWDPMLAEPDRLKDSGYQPYAVLSMCRSLYTMRTGQMASKSTTAEWALAALPVEWSPLITHAIGWRDGDRIESIERTTAFMRTVIELCRGA
jgi:hypothetical protein